MATATQPWLSPKASAKMMKWYPLFTPYNYCILYVVKIPVKLFFVENEKSYHSTDLTKKFCNTQVKILKEEQKSTEGWKTLLIRH